MREREDHVERWDRQRGHWFECREGEERGEGGGSGV